MTVHSTFVNNADFYEVILLLFCFVLFCFVLFFFFGCFCFCFVLFCFVFFFLKGGGCHLAIFVFAPSTKILVPCT